MSETISLTKGAKLSLTKPGESAPTEVYIGCGWDPDPSAGNVDLDLSAVLFEDGGKVVDTVWYGSADFKNTRRPICSTGDNLTGEGDGDDEVMRVKLAQIDPKVKSIVFVITSYKGQHFSKIRNAFARLVDVSSGREVEKYRYDVSGMGASTALVIVKLYRHNNEWKINAIGDTLADLKKGCSVKDAIAAVQASYL